LCHPGDIFRHHQNPDLPRRVGLCTTAKESPGSTAAFPFWQPPLAQPYRRALPGTIRKRTGSACDQHIFADARSASLRKVGLWLVSELSPLGKMGLGWRPSEGRALHDRQGKPWLDRGISPFGHRLWPDRTNGPRHSTNTSSRTRGAHPFANSAFGLSRNCPR
jgi:hypothetical protein